MQEILVPLIVEAPVFRGLIGTDGLPVRSWQNPSGGEFSRALEQASAQDTEGLRGMLEGNDLFVWQSGALLHSHFERLTGIGGWRLQLASGVVRANAEAVADPMPFGWLPLEAEMDTHQRYERAGNWLQQHARLKAIYPNGFRVDWYVG